MGDLEITELRRNEGADGDLEMQTNEPVDLDVESESSPRRKGKHLTAKEIALCLSLRASSNPEARRMQSIANVVGTSVASVSRTLAQFSDTRPLARRYLEGSALPLARSVVEASTDDGALGVKVLTGLGVLGASVGHGVAVQVNVGCGAVDVEATLPVLPGTLGAP
jgi:hypothetical protein